MGDEQQVLEGWEAPAIAVIRQFYDEWWDSDRRRCLDAIIKRLTPLRLAPKSTEPTYTQVLQAIADIQEARQSHIQWAAHLRNVAHSLCEGCNDFAAHIGDATYHDEWIAKYNHVLFVLAHVYCSGPESIAKDRECN